MSDAVEPKSLMEELDRISSEMTNTRRLSLTLDAIERCRSQKAQRSGKVSQIWGDKFTDDQRRMLAAACIVYGDTVTEGMQQAEMSHSKALHKAAYAWVKTIREEYKRLVSRARFEMVKAADAASAGSMGDLTDKLGKRLGVEVLSALSTGFADLSVGDKHAVLRGVEIISVMDKLSAEATLKKAQAASIRDKAELAKKISEKSKGAISPDEAMELVTAQVMAGESVDGEAA